jgi:hypothetical protein
MTHLVKPLNPVTLSQTVSSNVETNIACVERLQVPSYPPFAKNRPCLIQAHAQWVEGRVLDGEVAVRLLNEGYEKTVYSIHRLISIGFGLPRRHNRNHPNQGQGRRSALHKVCASNHRACRFAMGGANPPTMQSYSPTPRLDTLETQ